MSASTLASTLESLSKTQVDALLAVLPTLTQSPDESVAVPVNAATPRYSIAEMFTKKKKNAKANPAQNYLVVSG